MAFGKQLMIMTYTRLCIVVVVVDEELTYLETAVRPGTEFHEACLSIKGEIADVNLTVGFEYGWWIPVHIHKDQ